MASTSVAAAAADGSHKPHLRFEALPIIDLRLFTQSELYALSLSSSAPAPSSQDDFVAPIPKIDRSVFNESAGSRQQTYFRLRLAPRNSSPNLIPISRQKISEPLAEENSRIISLLKGLFAPHAASDPCIADPAPVPDNDGKINQIPIRIEYEVCAPEPSTSVPHTIPMEITDTPVFKDAGTPVFKRKRGRPRKHENPSQNLLNSYRVKQVVVVNASDNKEKAKEENRVEKRLNVVNLDRFEEELRKRTEGLRTEDELSVFLSRLSGEWGSRKKKRRIVEANGLADVLPIGWKLLLSIKNDGNRIWLGCSRYISPDGQQFESCEDVSKHLLSPFDKDASQSNSGPADDSSQLPCKISSGNSADPSLPVDQSHHEVLRPSSIPSSSVSDHPICEPLSVIGGPENCQTKKSFNCHKCTMTFDEKDNLLLHLLSSHKKTRNAARNGMPNPEAVIMKDGKYECQLCRRLFEEKNRFSSHFGNHIKDYVRRVEGSAETTRGRKPKLQQSSANDRVSSAVPYNTKMDSGHDMGFSHAIMNLDTIPKTLDVSDIDHANLPSTTMVERHDEHVCDDVAIHETVSDLPNDAVEVLGETSRVASELNMCKGVEQVKPCSQNVGTSEATDPSSVLKTENKDSMEFVNLQDDHTKEVGLKSDVAAPDEKHNVINNENLVSSLFDSSMEEMELDDGEEVGNSVLISDIGDPCFGLEEGILNYNKQQKSAEGTFVQNVDEKIHTNDNVIETQASTVVGPEKETVSASCLPLPSEQQTGLPDSSKDGVIGSTVEEDRPYHSWNIGKTVDFDGETATLTNDVKSSAQESGKNCPVTQSLDQNACNIEENADGNSISKVEHLWQQKVLKSSSLSAPLRTTDLEQNGSGHSVSDLNELWQRKVVEPESSSLSVLDTHLKKNSSEELGISMSSPVTPSLNLHRHSVEVHENRHYTKQMENPWQQKVFENNSLSSSPMKNSGLDGNIMNVSPSVVEPFKVNHDTRPDSPVGNHEETQRNPGGGFPFAAPHQQSFLSVNNEPCVSSREELKDYMSFKGPSAGYQDYDNNVTSFSVVEKQKPGEATSTWNNPSSFTFDSHYPLHDGNASMGFVQERSADTSSHLFTRNTETAAPSQRGAVVYGGDVEEQGRNKETLFGLFSPNVDQQTCINYNMDIFFPGTMQSDCRVGNVGPTRTNELMTGFFNQPKPREEVTQPMWRTEENALQNDLNYVSPSIPQQPDCFQSFNMVSNKVQNEFFATNQKLGNTAAVEGIRMGGGEYMEYNFLPAQSTTNHSGSAKITPLNQQMQPSYNSNWLEKEALGLFPKMGGSGSSSTNNSNRHQVTTTVCVWCGNQFTPEAGFTAEAGSVGYMCFNCKAKLSGQINFF